MAIAESMIYEKRLRVCCRDSASVAHRHTFLVPATPGYIRLRQGREISSRVTPICGGPSSRDNDAHAASIRKRYSIAQLSKCEGLRSLGTGRSNLCARSPFDAECAGGLGR